MYYFLFDVFLKPQSNTTDTFTPSEIAFLYVFRSLWSNLKNLSKCLKSRILTNRSDVVQLLSLYASAFLQILLLRLFPALLLLYFLSVPVTVTQKKSVQSATTSALITLKGATRESTIDAISLLAISPGKADFRCHQQFRRLQ